ncbi:stonustoxin subunit alpha-like [Acipenser ruthenus]|uniref:stonustoxin subunit alpha-like n=1 Tax=Acipenser ruthenus TaxID=7906 RepID=UPI0027410FAF|nr:stonustoxin subunit alpha-like [Acipenser ruthenus]XP_058872248.1 stonustoxin subunit alpha-like [Acipenser ruthenus]XP_058872249.1 stonustoxin subunit alpha-like [Acipenser ruthenus]
MANTGDETLEMAALGRPFQLGMLYDCRKDRLIPGITLWNPEQLKGSINKENQPITEFSVSTSDSIEEKASALKVDASLKASLLGDLVKVGGAAKYFNDTKKSTRQSRVTLQYYTTTRFENLTMNHLAKGKASHTSVFEDKTATHVVTAVLYGAQAYFIFDRQVSSEEKKQEIHGKMELAISKIPKITIKGQGSIDLEEKEKAEVEKFECTFYGDFHLESNPLTYQDAVKAYSTLPKLLGDKGENAVPVKVWLYPLIKLDSKAAKLERNISDYLVTSAETVLEQFNTIEMQSNDMIKDIVTQTFPEVNEKIQQLKQSGMQYKLNFMRKLSAVLPSIRGGVQEEESLGEILKNHEESPFNFKAQHAWLNSKEREINAVRHCLAILKDIHAVSSVNELDKEELNNETENIVCFTFTSLHEPEPYLEDLKNYLKIQASKNTQSSSPSKYLHQETKQWVSSETKLKIRMYLNVFQELVNINRKNKKTKFFIASKEDQEFPGACILLHENGASKYIHFKIPAKPDVPEVCDVTHDSVTLKVVPPSSDADQKLKYRLECINQKEWAIETSTDKTETLTVSGLQPNIEYEFRCTVEGKLGYSVSSDTTSKVKTTSSFAQDTVNKVAVYSLQAPEPRNRAEFLKYSCQLTLDPNTAFRKLCLSEGNRKVTWRGETQRYSDHSERFDYWEQVLCREGLSGTRCYWEIECSGGGAYIGVTYKGISRKGMDGSCLLGFNDKSWSLECSDSSYTARHNNNHTAITAPHSPRIGVYLDFNAGTLSFYGVSDTMTLLHRFQTTFTEPLYPGFRLYYYDSPVTICQLN